MENDGRAGARWLDVAPERLPGWLSSFAQRHGDLVVAAAPAVITYQAADGAAAACYPPFPPLPPGPPFPPGPPGPPFPPGPAAAAGAASPADVAGTALRLCQHATADRMVGVLLVRLGGYAAGVFSGAADAAAGPRLIASKVGSRLVHGRSAAGGTSQRRFARRREKQAAEALGAAADCAAAVLGPYADRLDAVVLGGDKRAMAGLRGDPRLRPVFDLATDRFLTGPDPRLTVLKGTPRLFRAIRVHLTEPVPDHAGPQNAVPGRPDDQ